ncbi:MAG: hypothetical protein Aurels2KO_49880 [Aureliella sp.]
MSSENEKESIKLQLLGVEQADQEKSSAELSESSGEVNAADREKVRSEILARRERYLAAKRTQPIYKPKRRRWGAAPAILLAVTGVAVATGLVVRSATATQEKKNQAYAVQMLDSARLFDLQDLVALSSTAAQAEDLLPDASLLGLASDDWDRLYTASRAARCLFTARMGNVELAIEQIDATSKLADRLADQSNASEPRLIANLCVGKAGVAVCELLANNNGHQQAQPYAQPTLDALQDAYVGLGESTELSLDRSSVLAAGLQLDMARLRTRGINPSGTSEEDANAAIFQHAALAREHLDRIQTRGGDWWNQQLRLEAHELLMRERQVRFSRIESGEIRRLLETVGSIESEIAPIATTDPEFATSLNYHFAIYISNLLDLLTSSIKEDQTEEFGTQLIVLRGRVIEKLLEVSVYNRTHLHHTNLSINYARRMAASCQMAVYAARKGDDPSEDLLEATLDARSLEATSGNLLGGKQSQLSTSRQILASVLIGNTSEAEIQSYTETYPPHPEDQTLIEEVQALLSVD